MSTLSNQLTIIGAPQGNFVWTARIAATEKGVAYRLDAVMPHTPQVDVAHPLGKIPAMRHGDVLLGESRAICCYIDRVFDGPSLIPADPVGAARTEQWVSIVCTHVDPLLVRQYVGAYYFPDTADGSPDRKRIDPIQEQMQRQFWQLDVAVGAAGHLAGAAFTLADAYLIPILFYLNQLPESSRMMQGTRYLSSYLERRAGRCTTAPKPTA